MKIAIEGCCHGRLDDIYGAIQLLEQKENCKIDLVLICGDFQAVRNEADLECMSVPAKYRHMGTFYKYYTGQARAPYPTIFIGGNHEASNYLWELYHGGWVCDNIYYLGHSGVVQFGGLRIGGLSGIFKENHYQKGHYERLPYNPVDLKSAYHVREYDVEKLLQISKPMDIFLSHDWPRGVERYGDLAHLMQIKKYFVSEIMTNTLGSQPNELLLSKLQPSYWFSAHLHVHYAALVNHDMWKKGRYPPRTEAILNQQNPNEAEIDQESSTSKVTRFLSLDKCLPQRQFLQIIDIPSPHDEAKDYDFYYDMEWLAITRAMHPYLSTQYQPTPLPSHEELKEKINKELSYLESRQQANLLDLKIPHNFEPTAPGYLSQGVPMNRHAIQKNKYPFLNPQTVQFCKEIEIDNKINCEPAMSSQATVDSPTKRIKTEQVHSEILIDDDLL
ncbi:lariat debranching enzyme, C-terminal domain-containing protein [Choanephora cucurbitarum]|nr:lariat debranching enzyme, C-terminal domain-containing protein [Choanephora cucurbitarum]